MWEEHFRKLGKYMLGNVGKVVRKIMTCMLRNVGTAYQEKRELNVKEGKKIYVRKKGPAYQERGKCTLGNWQECVRKTRNSVLGKEKLHI